LIVVYIADYIASNFSTEMGAPYEKGRKLHYMVNAILSSPKYKYLFQKDQVLKDEKRSLWRLKRPGDILDEETPMPIEMSLSSLIPPTSPCLSLKASRDDVESLATSTPTASSTPITKSSTTFSPRESYGGSNEGDKHVGVPRTTEHPHSVPSPTSIAPSSPSSPCPSSPLPGDAPSLSLSARRKKRKNSGLDSSMGSESGSPKQEDQGDEKKRRLDIAAA
jgi:hypothetical protein